MSRACCENCLGFIARDTESGVGECRRHAPTPLIVAMVQVSALDPKQMRPVIDGFFPPVTKDGYCLEHVMATDSH